MSSVLLVRCVRICYMRVYMCRVYVCVSEDLEGCILGLWGFCDCWVFYLYFYVLFVFCFIEGKNSCNFYK